MIQPRMVWRTAPIRTTREAHAIAELGQDWAIIGRQVFAPSCTLQWLYCGRFGTDEGTAFRKARMFGSIVTITGRDAEGNVVLYAKLAKPDNRRLRKLPANLLRSA